MKVTAVIAEYNPFHNGHLYQLRTIRTAEHADWIVVVLSGDFMQRGIPAMSISTSAARWRLQMAPIWSLNCLYTLHLAAQSTLLRAQCL